MPGSGTGGEDIVNNAAAIDGDARREVKHRPIRGEGKGVAKLNRGAAGVQIR